MTCTACRYGDRPTSWPGSRPGFSNSTSKVRPAKPALKARCWRSIERLQPLQPLGLDRLRHLVLEFGARRAGARRIFEGERAGVADLLDQRERVLEIGIGLAGKADDEVRRTAPDRAAPRAGARSRRGIRRACACGSSPQECGRSPTAPADAGTASVPADRDAPRSGRRACRADGWWCSAGARCRAPRRSGAAVARASSRRRPVRAP